MSDTKNEEEVSTEIDFEAELNKVSSILMAVFDQMGISEMRIDPQYLQSVSGSMRMDYLPAETRYLLVRNGKDE